jgi:intracellular septation protein
MFKGIQYDTRPSKRPAPNPAIIMQLLIEFLPILSFFVAYKFAGVYIATGVMLGALLLVVAFQWFKHRRIGPMLLVSAGIGLVFGSLTIWLHDQTFVQLKPTAVYWLLALVLICGRLFSNKPLVQRLMDSALELPEAAWQTLNTIWAMAFILIGAINLYVMYHYDLDTWVNFKAYGLTGLMVLFALGQAIWLASKLPPEPDKEVAHQDKQQDKS